ncbi:MAG TPA: GNAT family N-acetyltransferase [Stellaceae bacterium]|nr:GNAT family N-acetyltransferase [Stellaceae bacterium]
MSAARGGITIRFATENDCGLILHFIRELALYEKAPEAVVATEEQLRRFGFGPERHFEALIAELDGAPVGMALFHPRFSTWTGTPTVYLEDLYVAEAARGHGVGRRLMARLAKIALQRGWVRIDFAVLNWNPARDFYRKLGFDHLDEWLRYGAAQGWLERLAAWDEPG